MVLSHQPSCFGGQIDHRGLDVGMPEDLLDRDDVRPTHQHVGCQAVAEQMRVDALFDSSAFDYLFYHSPERPLGITNAMPQSREEIAAFITRKLRQVLQDDLCACSGDGDRAVLGALSLDDMDQSGCYIDVTTFQVTQLFAADPRICQDGQHGALPHGSRGCDDHSDLGLRERLFRGSFWLARTAQLDLIPQELSVAFQGQATIGDMVKRVPIMQRCDVGLDLAVAWCERLPLHQRSAHQFPHVTDAAFAESDIHQEKLAECVELVLQHCLIELNSSVDCDYICAKHGITPFQKNNRAWMCHGLTDKPPGPYGDPASMHDQDFEKVSGRHRWPLPSVSFGDINVV